MNVVLGAHRRASLWIAGERERDKEPPTAVQSARPRGEAEHFSVDVRLPMTSRRIQQVFAAPAQTHLSRGRERAVHIEEGDDTGVLGRHGGREERSKKGDVRIEHRQK